MGDMEIGDECSPLYVKCVRNHVWKTKVDERLPGPAALCEHISNGNSQCIYSVELRIYWLRVSVHQLMRRPSVGQEINSSAFRSAVVEEFVKREHSRLSIKLEQWTERLVRVIVSGCNTNNNNVARMPPMCERWETNKCLLVCQVYWYAHGWILRLYLFRPDDFFYGFI